MYIVLPYPHVRHLQHHPLHGVGRRVAVRVDGGPVADLEQVVFQA